MYDVETLIKWGKYAIALAVFTIVYNVGEGVVAIYYGWEEESISLLGFGCDSFVEVFSATIVLVQLLIKEKITEGRRIKTDKKKNVECERKSTIVIGILLVILALSAMGSAGHRLYTKS